MTDPAASLLTFDALPTVSSPHHSTQDHVKASPRLAVERYLVEGAMQELVRRLSVRIKKLQSLRAALY